MSPITLIFLDIESSGLDPFKHRVFEIAFKIVDAYSGEELFSFSRIVKQPQNIWDNRDIQSTVINGFTQEKLLLGFDEAQIRLEIIDLFSEAGIQRGKSVFICQNPSFDRNFFSQLIDVYTQERLQWPYHWLDFASMFWAISIKHQPPLIFNELQLSKNMIAKHYNLPIETTPHTAINGVNHLILCYKTVIGFPYENK